MGHAPGCSCDACSGDQKLRTHLLLDMSYSRLDGEKKRSKGGFFKFNFFNFRRKSGNPNVEDTSGQPAPRVTFVADENMEAKRDLSTGEPVTLATLKQDCFMIPMARMTRFFPAGHQIPSSVDNGRLRMLETADPSIQIVFHMIGPAIPVSATLQNPLLDLHTHQKMSIVKAFKAAAAGFNQTGGSIQGMVLLNLEKGGELGEVAFPFMVVWMVDTKHCEFATVLAKLRQSMLDQLDPAKVGYNSQHYFDTFDEVAALARPPLDKISRKPSTSTTGYIISVFKVFVGDDGQKFERNWLYWTGARVLYKSMTSDVGLKRLTLHKSGAQNGHLHYVLLCDCANFLTDVSKAVGAVPSLRMRLCGDTGLYRPICTF